MQGQDTNLSNVIIIYSINLETDVMCVENENYCEIINNSLLWF